MTSSARMLLLVKCVIQIYNPAYFQETRKITSLLVVFDCLSWRSKYLMKQVHKHLYDASTSGNAMNLRLKNCKNSTKDAEERLNKVNSLSFQLRNCLRMEQMNLWFNLFYAISIATANIEDEPASTRWCGRSCEMSSEIKLEFEGKTIVCFMKGTKRPSSICSERVKLVQKNALKRRNCLPSWIYGQPV